jgi:predicted negative regulator of RcsB-dependent stress response
MEKDPDLRYSTAGAMAEDLRRYLNRFAILARRAGPITRLKKWVKRSPGLTAVLACLVVAIIATGFFAWRAYDAERLRLAERQQYAIDMVELEAMSGDFDEAEEAIAEAERFGASPGQVRMLKGQVALHSGDAKTAVRELQQAVGLMPESVAARALLAMAHFQNNEAGTAFGGDLKALARLEPRTAEDFLFLGHFEAMIDPQRGLTFLNEAVRLRNSPVMWLARAEARSYLAMDTGDPEDAAEAVKDAIVAKQLIPDNAAVLAVNLFAQHVEARVCRVNAPQQAHEAMVQASQDSKALEVAPLSVVWRRVMFHDYAGEKQKCLELASAARAEGNHSADHLCAVVLAEQNDYVAALDVLREDSPNGTTAWYLTMRGFVLALQPDAPDRVRAAYDQAALLPRSDMMMDLYPQTILRLLGPKHKEEALQVCRAISERRSHWPPTKKAWYMRLLDYNSGFCSAHELLNEAKGSRWSECEAHFFIAMTCLADGDHRGAREHFEAVVNTDVFSFNEHLWSRMFLARMKQDEAWPRWIDPTTIER